MLAQPRIPVLEQGKQLVADTVAGESEVTIRRIFAPILSQLAKIDLNLGTADAQQRPQNAPLRELHRWVDAGKSLGPGAAQKFSQHSLGLIVAGVGGSHRIHLARVHQLAEPGIPQTPRRLLDGFPGLARRRIGHRLGGGIGARLLKGQAEPRGQGSGKLQVGVGFGSAQPVMQMGGMHHQTQFPAPFSQSAQQGHRVRAARKTDGEPHPGLEQRCIDREIRGQLSAHAKIITGQGGIAPEECAACWVEEPAAARSVLARCILHESCKSL